MSRRFIRRCDPIGFAILIGAEVNAMLFLSHAESELGMVLGTENTI